MEPSLPARMQSNTVIKRYLYDANEPEAEIQKSCTPVTMYGPTEDEGTACQGKRLKTSFGKAVGFGDERKSNKQDLSGLNAFPDVLPVSSCDGRWCLIEENTSLCCDRFPCGSSLFFHTKKCQCSLELFYLFQMK